MANVKVKSVGAVFNGQPIGSTFELTKAEADHYLALGYVELVADVPKPKAKAESAPTNASKPAEKPKPQRKSTKDK